MLGDDVEVVDAERGREGREGGEREEGGGKERSGGRRGGMK